jgi:hypothetical protein
MGAASLRLCGELPGKEFAVVVPPGKSIKMKKFKSEELIDELQADVRQLILSAEHLRKVDIIKLGLAPAEGKWSVAQCLEHLNAYNRYYLPAIDKSTSIVSKDVSAWFIPGYWGEKFTKMMRPQNIYEVKNKMKAPKGYAPERTLNVDAVFSEFIEHQNKLLRLLDIARKRNLNTIKIPISISRLIRFKLGDTFRFLIAHEQRHMIQARNAAHALGITTDKFPVILQGVPQ